MRSVVPQNVSAHFLGSPTALAAQSRCDCRGEAHGDGWGAAALEGEQLRIHRSTLPAHADPRFAALASSLATTLMLAHVRQASVGQVSIENTHPFAHGRWAFAHNGTLQNFAAGRARLLAAIPRDLQAQIAGQTDSEHIFYLLLGKIRAFAGSLDDAVSPDALIATLSGSLHLLDAWFPAHNGEQTKLNFLLTDGRLLTATCWKHSLHVLDADGPEIATNLGQSLMIASEPTSDGPWQPVADRSLLVVDKQLHVHRSPIDV